jgi:hypothetical protein
MTVRPKPLPPENDEVVFGVSSVLLTGSAQFSAAEDDAAVERVDLGGGRRGGVAAVEAWRQALRRDLNVLGLKTKTAILAEGRMAGVYLAELDEPELRRAADEATVEHGAAAVAKRRLELRLPLFERYRDSLPAYVQRRHADALEAAMAKAQRGVDALQDLYGR